MEYLSQIVEHGPDAVLIKTPTQIVYANRAALVLFGAAAPEELLGKSPLELIAPEDREEVLSQLRPLFLGEVSMVRTEKPMICLDGGRIHVEISAALLQFDGQAAVQSVIRDITERRQTTVLQSRLTAIVESSQDAILSLTPDGTIVAWNPAAERLYGYVAEEIVGQSIVSVYTEGNVKAVRARLRRALSRHRVGPQEEAHVRKDGSLVDVSVALSAILAEDGTAVGVAATVRDITARLLDERRTADQLIQVQEYAAALEARRGELERGNIDLARTIAQLEKTNTRLAALANADGLTGLLNHRAFQERLAAEVGRAGQVAPLSVILLDVDDFKHYNDTHGHPAGDAVLKAIAVLLQGGIRDTDVVARYGGEEFVLILPKTDGGEAAAIASRLRHVIETAPWPLRTVTASFGVCTLTPEMGGASDLITHADAAMYRAKVGGRNQVATA